MAAAEADAGAAAAGIGCSGGGWAGWGGEERLQWGEAVAEQVQEQVQEVFVERPMRTGALVLVEDGPAKEPAQLADAGARQWWAGPLMRRFWTYGHRVRCPPYAARAHQGWGDSGLPAQARVCLVT